MHGTTQFLQDGDNLLMEAAGGEPSAYYTQYPERWGGLVSRRDLQAGVATSRAVGAVAGWVLAGSLADPFLALGVVLIADLTLSIFVTGPAGAKVGKLLPGVLTDAFKGLEQVGSAISNASTAGVPPNQPLNPAEILREPISGKRA